ncbi:MAG TPA: DUF4249 domain-containing protein [Cytophagaceae bacterium]
MNKLILLIATIFLISCNMERDADVVLPVYEPELVVECYLIPGEPFRLSVHESVSYFEAPHLPEVNDALVTISYKGTTDTLEYLAFEDPVTRKYFNYFNSKLVPKDYETEFILEIKDKKGRVVRGKTKLLPIVKIHSIDFVYNSEGKGYARTFFEDDLSTTDYYRYQVTRDTYIGDEMQDFIFTDESLQTSSVEVGGSPRIFKGDYVIVTLHHLTKEHYDFLLSISYAKDANGNPFGQPARIKSNIEGGVGIFTGLSYDRKELYAF